ncbi:hypothetical protein NDN08_000500 [Rhodosorus marinus]|uniref:C2 domain-containing protein n=1 Tax=Rhodosorus marinus TaxID=101924 RepID=A0AAV8UPM7_9RHOD|nr:hypothetical protein NDN08_000500 [Rhodosorus marinus]
MLEAGVSSGLSLVNPGADDRDLVPYTEASVVCKGLRNRDFGSLSDPFAILYELLPNGVYLERDRTEVIFDDLNPNFCHKFSFEEQDKQKTFQMTIMDYDVVKKDDFLGNVRFTPQQLESATDGVLELEIQSKNGKISKKNGISTFYVERLMRSREPYKVGMELGLGADCKVESKKKIFLCLSRSTANSRDYVRIFRSEAMQIPSKKGESFVLPTFEVDSSTLTAQDPERHLLLELLLEGGRKGNHRNIGEVVFKVGKLDNLRAGESIAFFSGLSGDGRCRPQLVFPCMNWNVGRSTSVIVMRVSNLLIRW